MNWANLTKEERQRYMYLQMSPASTGYGGYNMPDDCSECGACGQPILGTGWCDACGDEWELLDKKLRGN